MSKGSGGTKRAGGSFTASLSKAGIDIGVSRFADKQAERLFGGSTPTAAELKSAFAVPGVKTDIKVTMEPSGAMRVDIWGAGVMGERKFRRGSDGVLRATHESFYLQQHLQGKGTGSQLLRNQEAAYKRWGVKEIHVPRAAETGRYFWPSRGFTPDNMGAMRKAWAGHLKAAGKSTKGAERASIKSILKHPEGKKFLMSTEPFSATKKL